MMKKFLFLILTGIFLSVEVFAKPFEIKNVFVSSDAETTALARNQALQEAQMTAFSKLMTLIVDVADLERITLPETADLLNMVQDVSVQDEKTTPTRYMASVSVRFDADAVHHFLMQAHVPYLSEMPPSYVVVPEFISPEGESVSLDESNPLYIAFKNKGFQNPLYQLKVPLGDAEDLVYAGGLNTVMTQEFSVDKLRKKYHADQVLLVSMVAGKEGYTVTSKPYPAEVDDVAVTTFFVKPFLTVYKSADIVADQLINRLEQQWRNAKTNRYEIPEAFTLVVPIQSLIQWNQIYNKLKTLDFLTSITVQAMRRDHMIIELGFKGSLSVLLHRLTQRGVPVEMRHGVLWINTSTEYQDAGVVHAE